MQHDAHYQDDNANQVAQDEPTKPASHRSFTIYGV
jgi:hypothetical protein